MSAPAKPRDRGIIFSAPMVQAIMAGRKTQTRRLVRLPKWASRDPGDIETGDDAGRDPVVICEHTGCFAALPLPLCVGDRLWVKEVFQEFLLSEWPASRTLGPRGRFGIPTEMAKGNVSHVAYRADGEWPDHPEMGKALWRSPIHMPRWASRLTLAVTDVRAQRLQEISEADAVAEGIAPFRDFGVYVSPHYPDGKWRPGHNAYTMYRDLWNSIHGPTAWDANPWVSAISFEVRP